MINNSIVIRSVNTNVNAPSANFSFRKEKIAEKQKKIIRYLLVFPFFITFALNLKT